MPDAALDALEADGTEGPRCERGHLQWQFRLSVGCDWRADEGCRWIGSSTRRHERRGDGTITAQAAGGRSRDRGLRTDRTALPEQGILEVRVAPALPKPRRLSRPRHNRTR